jgi:hypothetical protein
LAIGYLVKTGHDQGATVNVSGTQVDVTVQWDQPMQLLGVVGINSMHVSGSGSARNARGVVVEE